MVASVALLLVCAERRGPLWCLRVDHSHLSFQHGLFPSPPCFPPSVFPITPSRPRSFPKLTNERWEVTDKSLRSATQQIKSTIEIIGNAGNENFPCHYIYTCLYIYIFNYFVYQPDGVHLPPDTCGRLPQPPSSPPEAPGPQPLLQKATLVYPVSTTCHILHSHEKITYSDLYSAFRKKPIVHFLTLQTKMTPRLAYE